MGILKENYLAERVALGKVPGVTQLNLFGLNISTITSHETLWAQATLYAFLSANMSAPTISSGSSNDTAAGTGARTVYVEGVDSTFTVQSETITLNGNTEVALVNSYMTINKMKVLTAGSSGRNEGVIYIGTGTVTAGVPAVVHSAMQATMNDHNAFIYAVPKDKTLLIREFYCASRSATTGGHEVVLEAYENFGIRSTILLSGFLNTGGGFKETVLLPVYQKTQLQATVLSGAGTGPVYGYAKCWLIDNDSNALGF